MCRLPAPFFLFESRSVKSRSGAKRAFLCSLEKAKPMYIFNSFFVLVNIFFFFFLGGGALSGW